MFNPTQLIKLPLLTITGLATSVGLNFPLVSQATPSPSEIGQCSETHITNIGARLIDGATGEPIVNSGVSVYLNNGILLISDESMAEAWASKAKDKVKLCLQSVPENCSVGDSRGKVYKVMNYRTGKEFIIGNSLNSCEAAIR